MEILYVYFLCCETKRLTALLKSMAAAMDRVKMAEQEEGPWTTVSHTDAFTSQTPVINVVTAYKCKFIMIS